MLTENDLFRIKNESQYIDNKMIKTISRRCLFSSFEETIKYTFNIPLMTYKLRETDCFKLTPAIKYQLITELLLQLLDFLSINTSERVLSSPAFVKETSILVPAPREKKDKKGNPKMLPLTYSTYKSLNKKLQEILPSTATSYEMPCVREEVFQKCLLQPASDTQKGKKTVKKSPALFVLSNEKFMQKYIDCPELKREITLIGKLPVQESAHAFGLYPYSLWTVTNDKLPKESYDKISAALASSSEETIITDLLNNKNNLASDQPVLIFCIDYDGNTEYIRSILPDVTYKNQYYQYFNPVKPNPFFLEKSPLAIYVYSHIDFFAKEYSESNRHRHYFVKNGRYFLAVLLRAIKSGDAPYTAKNKDGISLQSLNKLLKTFCITYSLSNELKTDTLERFLFLVNTEDVFHFSFTYQVFSDYRQLIEDYGQASLPGFKDSLNLIKVLQKIPLDSLKIALWNNNIKTIFESGKCKSNQKYVIPKPVNYLLPHNDPSNILIKKIETCILEIQKLTDTFYYVILSLYGILRINKSEVNEKQTNNINEKISFHKENIPRLMKEIVQYLKQNENSHPQYFKWSIVESNRDKKYFPDTIPSICNDFFNFLAAYAIYCTGDPEFPVFKSNMEQLFGVDRYLSFSLNHKKDISPKDK